MNVMERIAEILAEKIDISVDDISPEVSFEDMGLDSLDVVELAMTLEEAFGVKIELNEPVKTVGELTILIEDLLN